MNDLRGLSQPIGRSGGQKVPKKFDKFPKSFGSVAAIDQEQRGPHVD